MAGNSFGTIFKLTTFGESHGKAIGGIIEGVPSNLVLDIEAVQAALNRRRPGQSEITSPRDEKDQVQFLSGIFEGKSLGTPIGFIIPNEDQESRDYSLIKDSFRPSHADKTYEDKYGFRDYRGGGRSSARETACRVVGGAIAKQLLPNIKITAYVSAVGKIKMTDTDAVDFDQIDENPVRCANSAIAEKMLQLISDTKKDGDSVGGIITCVIQNVPSGLGEPVFDKLHAQLGHAMLSINAVKGFEYGSGFSGSQMFGSEHNDIYNTDGSAKTNFSGGIQGGISNGMDIYFNVAFKPVATIMKSQNSIDKNGNEITLDAKGRHDPCVVPRAVPIVEAMAAMVLADFYLMNKIQK